MNTCHPIKQQCEAGVGSVMSSFNEIDGIPATGNHWLLHRVVLRNKWGFNGFVVSDYTSVNEMIAHGMGDLANRICACAECRFGYGYGREKDI